METFDWRPNNHYILVRAIPSFCFQFGHIAARDTCIVFLGELYVVKWTGEQVSLHAVNVTWTEPLAFTLHFFKPVLDCS
jgi:hypothetical protein